MVLESMLPEPSLCRCPLALSTSGQKTNYVSVVILLVDPSASSLHLNCHFHLLGTKLAATLLCYADAIINSNYEILLPIWQYSRLGVFLFRIANARQF